MRPIRFKPGEPRASQGLEAFPGMLVRGAIFALAVSCCASLATVPRRGAGEGTGAIAISIAWAADPALEEVLRRVPSGSKREQAAWLLEEARRTTDADLALRLTDEVLRRSDEGPAAAEARLWRARYWMVAGSPSRAAHELELMEAPAPGTPQASEAAYWRALSGVAGEATRVENLRNLPWDLFAILAAARDGEADRAEARTLLELEGSVRRWGLLGPWLWRLLRSGGDELNGVAEEIRAGARAELARAPERSALSGDAGVAPDSPGGEPSRKQRDDREERDGSRGEEPAETPTR